MIEFLHSLGISCLYEFFFFHICTLIHNSDYQRQLYSGLFFNWKWFTFLIFTFDFICSYFFSYFLSLFIIIYSDYICPIQAHPIPPELTAKLLGNRVAVSPIVTVEPRRRKFHKPITLTIPVPQAAGKGMINQYNGETPTLRLLCSITGTSQALDIFALIRTLDMELVNTVGRLRECC